MDMSGNNNENKDPEVISLDSYLLKRQKLPRNPYEGKIIRHFSDEQNSKTMDLLALMDSDAYQESTYFYRLPLGISDGTVVIENLSDISNLLITGIPQSGKTAFINSLLMSLMLSHTPDEFCCFCFNSKPLEYPAALRHPYALLDSMRLTTGRTLLEDVLEAIHIARTHFPRIEIVIVLDDLYDFLHTYGRDNLINLLRMGISREIHVFMATNLVSGREVTPEIRSLAQNFISFHQYRDISRLLGIHDAQYLETPGEAIFHLNGMKFRCRTAYMEETELDTLNKTICQERKSAVSQFMSDMESFSQTISLSGITTAEDSLFDEIVDYVIDVQKASTSLLQRRFGIGFNHAQRMLDLMEEKGIIGPAQGSKPREVYLKRGETYEQYDTPVPSKQPELDYLAYSLSETLKRPEENTDPESESIINGSDQSPVSKLIYPEQPLVRKVTRIKEEAVVKHYGIDTTCWIEDGKLVIETTDLDLLPEEYVRDAQRTARGLFRRRTVSKATFSMDIHKINRVTFGRPKKHKGYVHVYFDEVSIDIDVTGSDETRNSISNLDIMIPFVKDQESEFELFAKELVRKSKT